MSSSKPKERFPLDMPPSSPRDVVIVGGGAIGLCCGAYLQQAGRRVLVLDKGPMAGACSKENAGLIVPSHAIPLAAPGVMAQGLKWMFRRQSPFAIKPRFDSGFFRWLWHFRAACTDRAMRRAIPVLRDLLLASSELYEDLASEDRGFSLEKKGLYLLYASKRGRSHCLTDADLARGFGLSVEPMGASQLRAREPHLKSAAEGAVYYSADSHINPQSFLQWVQRRFLRDGGELLPQTEVLGFSAEAGNIEAVNTNRGSIPAKEVVLAAGSWSPHLGKQLGLRVPVEAAKGYSITLPHEGGMPSAPLILTEPRVSITPLGKTMRFGGTFELAGLDHRVDAARIAGIVREARRYFTQLPEKAFEPQRFWSGFRPCSPDGLPLVGRSPHHGNLTLATGHAMLGISLAPITGLLVSQMLTESTPSHDCRPLAVDRFG